MSLIYTAAYADASPLARKPEGAPYCMTITTKLATIQKLQSMSLLHMTYTP